MIIVVFLGIICLTAFIDSSEVNQLACYNAKSCIHNSKQKCGVDKDGTKRRFFDSCDIYEYNCLKFTEFVKTSKSECDSLPPLDPARRKYEATPGQLAVIKKYWCWRAKYCHTKNNPVCGRDRRLKKTREFQCECTMYKHNCDNGHDYTAMVDDKSCMKHVFRRRY